MFCSAYKYGPVNVYTHCDVQVSAPVGLVANVYTHCVVQVLLPHFVNVRISTKCDYHFLGEVGVAVH